MQHWLVLLLAAVLALAKVQASAGPEHVPSSFGFTLSDEDTGDDESPVVLLEQQQTSPTDFPTPPRPNVNLTQVLLEFTNLQGLALHKLSQAEASDDPSPRRTTFIASTRDAVQGIGEVITIVRYLLRLDDDVRMKEYTLHKRRDRIRKLMRTLDLLRVDNEARSREYLTYLDAAATASDKAVIAFASAKLQLLKEQEEWEARQRAALSSGENLVSGRLSKEGNAISRQRAALQNMYRVAGAAKRVVDHLKSPYLDPAVYGPSDPKIIAMEGMQRKKADLELAKQWTNERSKDLVSLTDYDKEFSSLRAQLADAQKRISKKYQALKDDEARLARNLEMTSGSDGNSTSVGVAAAGRHVDTLLGGLARQQVEGLMSITKRLLDLSHLKQLNNLGNGNGKDDLWTKTPSQLAAEIASLQEQRRRLIASRQILEDELSRRAARAVARGAVVDGDDSSDDGIGADEGEHNKQNATAVGGKGGHATDSKHAAWKAGAVLKALVSKAASDAGKGLLAGAKGLLHLSGGGVHGAGGSGNGEVSPSTMALLEAVHSAGGIGLDAHSPTGFQHSEAIQRLLISVGVLRPKNGLAAPSSSTPSTPGAALNLGTGGNGGLGGCDYCDSQRLLGRLAEEVSNLERDLTLCPGYDQHHHNNKHGSKKDKHAKKDDKKQGSSSSGGVVDKECEARLTFQIARLNQEISKRQARLVAEDVELEGVTRHLQTMLAACDTADEAHGSSSSHHSLLSSHAIGNHSSSSLTPLLPPAAYCGMRDRIALRSYRRALQGELDSRTRITSSALIRKQFSCLWTHRKGPMTETVARVLDQEEKKEHAAAKKKAAKRLKQDLNGGGSDKKSKPKGKQQTKATPPSTSSSSFLELDSQSQEAALQPLWLSDSYDYEAAERYVEERLSSSTADGSDLETAASFLEVDAEAEMEVEADAEAETESELDAEADVQAEAEDSEGGGEGVSGDGNSNGNNDRLVIDDRIYTAEEEARFRQAQSQAESEGVENVPQQLQQGLNDQNRKGMLDFFNNKQQQAQQGNAASGSAAANAGSGSSASTAPSQQGSPGSTAPGSSPSKGSKKPNSKNSKKKSKKKGKKGKKKSKKPLHFNMPFTGVATSNADTAALQRLAITCSALTRPSFAKAEPLRQCLCTEVDQLVEQRTEAEGTASKRAAVAAKERHEAISQALKEAQRKQEQEKARIAAAKDKLFESLRGRPDFAQLVKQATTTTSTTASK